MISTQKKGYERFLDAAKKLHESAVVVDTHVDTTQKLLSSSWNIRERHAQGHVDVPRMQEGGVGAVFFAVWAAGSKEDVATKTKPTKEGSANAGSYFAKALEQIDRIQQCIEMNNDVLAFARTANDVREARRNGRIAVLIGIEGGYLIEDSLDNLCELHRRGATYMTLTHSFHTTWADSSGVHRNLPPLHSGLTDFGRSVIREMNRLGMLVDVSHASPDTIDDVLDVSSAPVVATHSSCHTVAPHRRNLSDAQIRAIAAGGGLVQINFSAAFIDPEFPSFDPRLMDDWWERGAPTDRPPLHHHTPLTRLVDHFDHALKLVGPRHVGIGSDFDGVAMLPDNMQDCSMLPNLTAALMAQGYGEPDLRLVLGGNVLRVMDECQSHARSL